MCLSRLSVTAIYPTSRFISSSWLSGAFLYILVIDLLCYFGFTSYMFLFLSARIKKFGDFFYLIYIRFQFSLEWVMDIGKFMLFFYG